MQEFLTDLTGTLASKLHFQSTLYYYSIICTYTYHSWQHPLAQWFSSFLVGYSRRMIVWKVGLEPTTPGATNQCSTIKLQSPYVGVKGFEPIEFLMCQIYSLMPIHHLSSTPIVLPLRFELRTPSLKVMYSSLLSYERIRYPYRIWTCISSFADCRITILPRGNNTVLDLVLC